MNPINSESNLIVIPTHARLLPYLDNLLNSIKNCVYPVLLVVTDYKKKDRLLFLEIQKKYAHLIYKILGVSGGHYNFGGLYAAYRYTEYENIFLLPSAVEILDLRLLDIIFKEHLGKSVAFSLMKLGAERPVYFWHGEVGKFRRKILDQMCLEAYLPFDVMEAIAAEFFFTSAYHALDPSTVVLFPGWVDSKDFEVKFGQKRMKIANSYLIRWKGHWNLRMIFDHLKRTNRLKYLFYKACFLLQRSNPKIFLKWLKTRSDQKTLKFKKKNPRIQFNPVGIS